MTFEVKTPPYLVKCFLPYFRFDEEGKIVEHWDSLATKADPNPSGRTQIDNFAEVQDLDKTEENRQLVKNFLHDVMQGKAPEKTPD